MKNICEWENCKETGEFKAPINKDNSKNYRWLCEEHIKLFNKNRNNFEGMDQNEIENFLKSDITWHRPTQKFGSSDNFFNILWNNALNDKFNFFKEEKNINTLNGKKLNEKERLYNAVILQTDKLQKYIEVSEKEINHFLQNDLSIVITLVSCSNIHNYNLMF